MILNREIKRQRVKFTGRDIKSPTDPLSTNEVTSPLDTTAPKMDNRPHKRPRPSHQSSYHDSVPLDHDYSIIYAREERSTLHSQPVERAPQPATDSWDSMSTWLPPDDSMFALDPDGGWYDVAVESHVMEEITPATLKAKKARSLVSVSLLLSSVFLGPHLTTLNRNAHMLHGCRFIARLILTNSRVGVVRVTL